MLKLPAGEFQLELSQSSSVVPTVLDSPEVVEISSESDVEMKITKLPLHAEFPGLQLPPKKFLTQEEEMQKMKENEKYGFLHRVDYRQEDFKKDLVRVREEIAREASADRKARRKSFQKAVLGVDSQDLQ